MSDPFQDTSTWRSLALAGHRAAWPQHLRVPRTADDGAALVHGGGVVRLAVRPDGPEQEAVPTARLDAHMALRGGGGLGEA